MMTHGRDYGHKIKACWLAAGEILNFKIEFGLEIL